MSTVETKNNLITERKKIITVMKEMSKKTSDDIGNDMDKVYKKLETFCESFGNIKTLDSKRGEDGKQTPF